MLPSIHDFYVKTKLLADFQICISVPSIAKFWLETIHVWDQTN